MANVKNGADMIERYVYAVTSTLPADQRAEIDREVRAMIEDMREMPAEGGAGRAGECREFLQGIQE